MRTNGFSYFSSNQFLMKQCEGADHAGYTLKIKIINCKRKKGLTEPNNLFDVGPFLTRVSKKNKA